jgi:hypothetical protein
MEEQSCPICGKRLTEMEKILALSSQGVQCRECWTRLRSTGATRNPFDRGNELPAILTGRLAEKKAVKR